MIVQEIKINTCEYMYDICHKYSVIFLLTSILAVLFITNQTFMLARVNTDSFFARERIQLTDGLSQPSENRSLSSMRASDFGHENRSRCLSSLHLIHESFKCGNDGETGKLVRREINN